MRKLTVTLFIILLCICIPFTSLKATKITNYSLMTEEDFNSFMVILKTDSKGSFGIITQFGGYQWFSNVHEKKWDSVRTFISPAVARESKMLEHFKETYIIRKIKHEFVRSGSDEFVMFYSDEAINVIKGYISQGKNFSFSSVALKDRKPKVWVAHTFSPVKNIDDLILWSKKNSYSFCQFLRLPMFINEKNLELNSNNLSLMMESVGISCDKNYNLIIKSTPTPCTGTYKPTWDNCTGTRTFSDRSRYTGQWKSGKEHGKGTLTYADGE